MREIKFRAYLHNEKEVVMVSDINFIEKWIGYYDTTGMNDAEAFELIRSGQHNADCPFERCGLMQYTGLKDKNGVEIYEGDIVSCTTFSYIEPLERIIATVSYSSRRMSFVFGEKSPLCYRNLDELTNDVYTYEIEILGNIYENPNLLEG